MRIGFWLVLGGLAAGGSGDRSDSDELLLDPPHFLPDGWMLVEGDILMREAGVEQALYETNTWPGGVVPYAFDPAVLQANRDDMRAAMDKWEAVAAVSFVPRTSQSAYVRVINSPQSGYNFSALGFQNSVQDLGISNWNQRVIVHELGHALGFQHEHSRSDRDQFIEIIWDNICQDCCNNFPCNTAFFPLLLSSRYGPYDFLSVMHYRQCTFSRCDPCGTDAENCRTIRARAGYEQFQTTMGDVSQPSFWDGRVMSFLYPQSNWRFIRQSGNDLFGAGTFGSPWQSWQHGYDQTPAGGQLWILEARFVVGPRVLSRSITMRGGDGAVIFE